MLRAESLTQTAHHQTRLEAATVATLALALDPQPCPSCRAALAAGHLATITLTLLTPLHLGVHLSTLTSTSFMAIPIFSTLTSTPPSWFSPPGGLWAFLLGLFGMEILFSSEYDALLIFLLSLSQGPFLLKSWSRVLALF